MLARPATGGRRRVIEPPAGPRVALREHPAYRARWQELRAAIAAAGLTRTPGPHLDQTADFFLVVEVGRAAMIRAAKADDPAFSAAEVDATGEALKKTSTRLRQVTSRLNGARKRGQPPERLEELEQQRIVAFQERFVAHMVHEAAVGRFNATWTEADHPSTRQLTTEENAPIASMALHLEGSFSYKPAEVARLLAATGFAKAVVPHEYGDKSPALDSLLKARSRARR
jgi:hypothetical protein